MTSKQQLGKPDALYTEFESKTNRDNCRGLIIYALVFLLCDILNEINIFSVDDLVMRTGTGLGVILNLLPVFILARPLGLFQKSNKVIVYRKWHKYLILSFVWMATFAVCTTLTHHTVIVMALPLMIMAQYHDTKKLVHISVVLSTICVFLGVYGGYFVGCFDGNLLHAEFSDELATNLALRFEMATPTRMYELLTHYALARELIVLTLTFLAARISGRNKEMLACQEELQSIAQQEMTKLSDVQWQIIDGMANLIENRDTNTGQHVKRTGFYVETIVNRLRQNPEYGSELTEYKADTIVRAAPLHDIGKIVVSDRILQKPGKLTADEYEEIKRHASEGGRVIKNVLGTIEDPDFLSTAMEIAVGHHERWDGGGYPKGLKGKEIPISARIVAVADVFDALISERVYKAAMSPDEAFSIIEAEAGRQFDPDVAGAFISAKAEIYDYLKE